MGGDATVEPASFNTQSPTSQQEWQTGQLAESKRAEKGKKKRKTL